MLVKKIMKVLSNLLGLNKKINANEIAIKENGKAITLDEKANKLDERLDNIEEELKEKDWIEISLNTGFSKATSGFGGPGGIFYKKDGNHIYLRGSISVANLSTYYYVVNLPKEIIPNYNYYKYSALSGQNIARIVVQNKGYIAIDWMISIQNATSVTSTSWLEITMDYWLD
jgi:hypothetical protein